MPFPTFLARRAMHGVLVAATFFCASVAASATVPIAAFFSHAHYSNARLSPNGKYLAARVTDKNGHDVLTVIALDTLAATVAAGYADEDVADFQWVNNDRLLYNLHDKRRAQGDIHIGAGLFAVDRDGTHGIQLAERDTHWVTEATMIKKKILPSHTVMLAPGAQEGDAVYVASPERDEHGYGKNILFVNLLRLDTVTGKSELVQRPGAVHEWWLDQRGEPRLAVTLERDAETVWYRDPATSAWRNLASFDAYAESPGSFRPVGFGADGALYVTAATPGGTSGLYRYNLQANKVEPEPLVAAPGYDFTGSLVRNRTRLLGVTMKTDARSTVWFDPAMQAIQKKVDQSLPGLVNLLTPAIEPGATNVLVASYSDRVPPRYALFNTETGQLNPISNSQPAIDPAQMGRQQMVSYKARDGLTIPALLTLPPGARQKNLPLVVLVHGGPWADGATWEWNRESQFLATRGYAVLEPFLQTYANLAVAR